MQEQSISESYSTSDSSADKQLDSNSTIRKAYPSLPDLHALALKDISEDTHNTLDEVHSPPLSTNQQNEKQAHILEAYRALNEFDIHTAEKEIYKAKLIEVSDKEIIALYTAINTWIEILKEANTLQTPEEKGDLLLVQWKQFEQKQRQYSKHSNNYSLFLTTDQINHFKHFAASLARYCYGKTIQQDPTENNNPAILTKVYRCLKLLGEYKEAFNIISKLYKKNPTSIAHTIEIADAYYLNKKITLSKAMFQKAFFNSSQNIELLENIQAPFIHDTITLMQKNAEISHIYIMYWIPVFGYIYNTLKVQRTLKPIEFHTIENDILTMESKLNDYHALGKDDINLVRPALLNRYFLILEHIKNNNENEHPQQKRREQQIQRSIKTHTPHIYELYKKNIFTKDMY